MFKNDLYLDNIALIHDGGTLTYKQLFNFEGELKKNIRSRKLVFLICSNSWESIALYVNLVNMKVPLVLFRSDIDTHQLADYAARYCPGYIISQSCIEAENFLNIDTFGRYSILVEKSNIPRKQLASNIAVLIPTSGSTGNPQLVMLSAKNLQENAKSIISGLRMSARERAITSLPMNYSFGLSIINTHLTIGASLAVTDYSVNERGFWDSVEKYGVTTIAAVPFSFNTLTRLEPEQYLQLGIQKILQAGGKLSVDLIQKMNDLSKKGNFEFYIMYGQTEATARVSILDYQDLDSHLTSVGKAIEGVHLWIQDEIGNVIESSGVEGEVCISGPNVYLGYANKVDDLFLKSSEPEMLATGDIGYLDINQFLYITGRKKRFTKAAGIRINLDDVDRFAHEAGFLTASISINDELCVATEKNFSRQFLQEEIARYLQIHPKLVSVYTIDPLPRNEAGKVLYQQVEFLLKEKLGVK